MLELEIQTDRRTQLVDITARVREVTAGSSSTIVTLFVPHTTAGLLLQAAGDGARQVAADVETGFERLVPEAAPWRHTDEGDRNPWAHVRASLTSSSVAIPLEDGELVLGEHQAIFLCELDGPRRRRVLLAL